MKLPPRLAIYALLVLGPAVLAAGCRPTLATSPANTADPAGPAASTTTTAAGAAPTAPTAPTARPRPAPRRFDRLVSGDFFAGFAGDAAALARGMQASEAALADDPLDAQPLMWHGMGTGYLAGQAYRRGDAARGRELEGQGNREAEQAVALAPDDVWVLVYYALDHSVRARHSDDPAKVSRLLEQATRAYEHTERLQAPERARLSVHDRGELLVGLADLWARRGNEANARAYLARAAREMPGTIYATKAQDWLDHRAPPSPTNGYTCLGCHEP